MNETVFDKIIGDMRVSYLLDSGSGIAGFCVTPACETANGVVRKSRIQPLAEVKIIGDRYGGNYFGGKSMKYSDTTYSLKYERCDLEENGGITTVTTYLKSESGLEAAQIITYREGRKYITVRTELINNTGEDIKTEMLSSFSLCDISPYLNSGEAGKLLLHRMRSKWSMEGRLVTEALEDLQLEESWTYGCSNSVRFGQIGSMPSTNYQPFMAVEDTQNGVIWGVHMGCPSSWQMEITRADDGVCLSGGIADREFGHWTKTLKDGECFYGNEAVISVCKGGVDDICARLLEAQEDALDVPACEEDLPVIFNEYCTTWGCPSHENIEGILGALDGSGIDYFVIDCGWFKEDGVRWDISMGDYIPSDSLFPRGIDETVKLIKSHGMRAGIWFEIENVGIKSKAYYNEEHLLKRDGITLTTQNRRFWDMNDEWVQRYLNERVIEFLKKHDFGYIKVDYNETMGIGCDNCDSLGEGLRQNQQASVEFFKKMRREIPDLVIENCASGGGRLEPCFMSLSSMASFSDAHECVEIPIIAANLHRAILPRQSQIWCVLRLGDTPQRIAYSVSAAFLGRMCLSGDITGLSDEQRSLVDRGIDFYKKAVPVIKNGFSRRFGAAVKAYRHPEGWQAVMRENNDMALCVIHTFKNAPAEISIPSEFCNIDAVYSSGDAEAKLLNGELLVKPNGDFKGIGILLNRA